MRALGGVRSLQIATAVVLTVLIGAPFAFIALQAVFPDIGSASFAHPLAAAIATMRDPDSLALAGHSLELGLCVAVASAAIGVPLGAMRGAMKIPGGAFFDAALFAPFVIPPYLSTLGWILFFQPRGWLQRFSGLDLSSFLFSFAGLVFVMTLNLFPIVYFAVSRAVASAGGRLASVARVFGASPLRAFARIVAPLIAPSLAGALLLVFSATIEEFGAPAALAGQSHFFVLVVGVDRRVSDAPVDLAGASTLSLILVAMALVAYGVQDRLLAKRAYATILGKPRAEADKARSRAAPFVALLFTATIAVSAGAPLLSIAAAAFSRTLSGGLKPSNLGLSHFAAIFSDADGALDALLASLGLGVATACATGAIGLAAAVFGASSSSDRSGPRGRLAQAISILCVLPNATPGIVVALGMILFWNQPYLPATVYGGWAMLVVAYSCILLPYPTRYASAALRQIGSSLEPAARVSGAGPRTALRRITAPLIAPSLIAAMMLVFAISSRELVASILLVPTGGETIATYIWRQFEQGSLGDGMALSLVAIAVTSTALALAAVCLGARSRAAIAERPPQA